MPTRSSACIAISMSSGRYQPSSERSAPVRCSRPMSTLLRTVVRFTRLKRLEDHADARADLAQLPGRCVAHAHVVDDDVALRERHEPVDGADERGLAGARQPDDDQHLAVGDVERQASQGMDAPGIGDGGVLEADRGHRPPGVEERARWARSSGLLEAVALAAVARALDRLADDLERLEVRLGEGRDLVDRVQDRRALLGGRDSRGGPA